MASTLVEPVDFASLAIVKGKRKKKTGTRFCTGTEDVVGEWSGWEGEWKSRFDVVQVGMKGGGEENSGLEVFFAAWR